MSSRSKGLRQLLTTKSGQPTGGRFSSADMKAHWAKQRRLLSEKLMGRQFGFVKVIGPVELVRGAQVVLCRCTGCGTEKHISVPNLTKGKSRGCQSCSQTLSKHTAILGRRYDAIVSRCKDPKNPHWRDYGGRGIECRFKSRRDFVLWVEQHLPHKDYRGAEIDRRDNDGHYEPGNLRLASRSEQTSNRRCTRRVSFRGEKKVLTRDVYHLIRAIDPGVRYAVNTVQRLAAEGLSVEQIITRYYSVASDKPKGCTTLPMPDPVVASRYLG